MMLRFSAFPWLLLASSQAFSPALRRTPPRVSPLQAADGAPQYDKIDAVLETAEKVAEGTYMLHVKVVPSDDVTLDYQPGHVLALELEDTSDDAVQSEDAKTNGGWMRGPYTVSRSTADSVDIMIRVVGKKSRAFAQADAGTPVRLGGKFKIPILEGIDRENVRKVVLLSTGVGVGPCVGAVEMALQQDASFPPIALFASYRESGDVAYRAHLDDLAQQYPTKFCWTPVITCENGRLSKNEDNMRLVTASMEDFGIADTHYHLIGNAQMVNEWKEGLQQAAVPGERVTVEQYFNHKAAPDEKAIATIASAIASACAVQV
jgi:ferredoxin-NADP reductase